VTWLRTVRTLAVAATAAGTVLAGTALEGAVPAGGPAIAAAPKPLPTPTPPVLEVQYAGTEMVIKVLNLDKTLTYRLSHYGKGAAGAMVGGSADGRFHVASTPGAAAATYVVQAVTRTFAVSKPDPESRLVTGTPGTYRFVVALAPLTVTAFAQAVQGYLEGLDSSCSGKPAVAAAGRALSGVAARAEKAYPVDAVLLARWKAAVTASAVPDKTCTAPAALATFAATEVASFLARKTSFTVAAEPSWNATKGTCTVRMIAGDANGRRGVPWITDLATAVASARTCQTLPQLWY
jgi:hypothetical protein